MTKTSRRSFLRGMGGSTLALPWMESFGKDSGMVEPARRIAWFYVPIGVVRRGFFPGEAEAGIPKFTGSRKHMAEGVEQVPLGVRPLELTPTMKPLEKMREKVTLITGMDRTFQPGTDVHAQCASCFLTSASAFTVTQSAYPLARSLDHVVADVTGENTPFRTLEFSCNSHKDNKESMYFDNISWYGTGHVAPSLRDPRKAYRRLFGTKEISAYRNITDLVLDDARSLKRRLGYSDQQKFKEYFDSIRTIEEQTEKLEKMRSQLAKARIDEPPEARLPRGEYIRLMGDLMVVALQTGLTNVATFMVGPERWDTPYLFESLFEKPRSHHGMSHNQGKYIDDLLKVDHFHMEQFAYLLDKMDKIREANGTSLLDNTIFTYGSGLGDGSTHQYGALPIIVAGSGGGRLATGKHINLSPNSGPVPKKDGKYLKLEGGIPLANLWLTQAQAMGLKTERFADSTGNISQLIA
ncbi:MAG: DUF1552 domain-containing protein [Verrucomicrobiaceae bacterium]|nr:DUF1552 domain-containing protein [Verrucomicrobiaceae bacterium]